MPDVVRAYVRYCLNAVRTLCYCLDIVLSVRTLGKVNSCNDIHRTYSMLMLRHCQNAVRHILIVSYSTIALSLRAFPQCSTVLTSNTFTNTSLPFLLALRGMFCSPVCHLIFYPFIFVLPRDIMFSFATVILLYFDGL